VCTACNAVIDNSANMLHYPAKKGRMNVNTMWKNGYKHLNFYLKINKKGAVKYSAFL
jgi:hypothetical protein